MQLETYKIAQHNDSLLAKHESRLNFAVSEIENSEAIIQKLIDFQIAIPSWALGTGGTRFGRFSGGGEPGTLEEKIEDVGLLHALNRSSGAISLHIPWDIPKDAKAIKTIANERRMPFTTAHFFKTRTKAMVMILPCNLGMSITIILEFMRNRITSFGIKAIEDGDACNGQPHKTTLT